VAYAARRDLEPARSEADPIAVLAEEVIAGRVAQARGDYEAAVMAFEQAERVFRKALEEFPNNAWALYGLREALWAQGKTSGVVEIDTRLDAAWAGEREELSLSRL
jgi:hypothetical protein